jgi:hypothetical protein
MLPNVISVVAVTGQYDFLSTKISNYLTSSARHVGLHGASSGDQRAVIEAQAI